MRIKLPEFPVEGGCVCGTVGYRLSASPLYVIACHCLTCQCLSGSDYVLSMLVRRDDFTLMTGKPVRCERTAESGRFLPGYFCPECGTRVWHEPVQTPNTINIRGGTLDDPFWASPIAHMWLSRKKSHVIVPPDVITYMGQPQAEDRKRLVEAWRTVCGL